MFLFVLYLAYFEARSLFVYMNVQYIVFMYTFFFGLATCCVCICKRIHLYQCSVSECVLCRMYEF